MSSERVMVFIDGSNIIHAANRWSKRNKAELKIDYEKLVNELTKDRKLIRAYFFGSYDPNNKPQRFYDRLSLRGIEVHVKPLRERDYGDKKYRVEKGIDVALVTKMLQMAF